MDGMDVQMESTKHITTNDQLQQINYLSNSKPISIDKDEFIFYSFLSSDINQNNYVYSRYIESDYIQLRTYQVHGSLISKFQIQKPVSNIQQFMFTTNDIHYIQPTEFYKVCFMEKNIFDMFVKTQTIQTVDDVTFFLEISNYMLFTNQYVYSKLYLFLNSLEKYAIDVYWNKLCKKPSYELFIKHRMFPNDDNLDNQTKDSFDYVEQQMTQHQQEMDDYVNPCYKELVEKTTNLVKHLYFDEISISSKSNTT
jgi:hypothetical protein